MPVQFRRRELLASGLILPTVVKGPILRRSAARSNHSFDKLLRPTVYSAKADPRWSIAERMAHYDVPGVSVAIIRDGQVQTIQGYGTRISRVSAPVGPATLFSVGSISKVATAALCLRLIALGHLDLDQDIGRWLTRWRVPPGPAGDISPITLRMLLSHTAGFNVHGFADFPPGAILPTLIQILSGTKPAKNVPLRRIDKAGARSRYSGGGFMIIQAVIEDAMGLPLDTLARRHVFAPLGMSRSTFSASLSPDSGDIAHAHDEKGKPVALPRGWQSFPELAASGLWTCADDLARLVTALTQSYQGKSAPFLPRNIAIDMMTPVSPGVFGLGPRLAGEGASAIFHHGGANASYNAYIEGNLACGDGVVILANGANGAVLGDEIRNGVSDAMGWPGDWSVATQPPAEADWLTTYTGNYRRRANQPPELAGLLDTAYDLESLEIRRTGNGLTLHIGDRTEELAPLTSSRFVAPDVYVPAGTFQLEFERSAERSVNRLIVTGGGALLFDKM